MSTRTEEHNALAKIRKIVADLGENSYIGTAFEGCFEIAEENIDNDFGCSMKQRADAALKDAAALKKQVEDVTSQAKPLADRLAETERKLTEAQLAAGALENTLDQTLTRVATAEQRADDAELLVTALKAKLYDYMTA